MRVYKLTPAGGITQGGTLWGEGIEHEVEWLGKLCAKGCLHAYASPLLAVLMDPIHAAYGSTALLWEAEADESRMINDGTKIGTAKLQTVRRVALPVVTTEQRVRFGILASLTLPQKAVYRAWAEKWLSGEDRSAISAWRAGAAGTARVTAAATGAAGAASRSEELRAARAASMAADVAGAGGALNLVAIAEQAFEK